MSGRIALVGRITREQRAGMEQHVALLSGSPPQPHCETWTLAVRPPLRHRLQDQMGRTYGLHLWVIMDGVCQWRFQISHALFFDVGVLSRDPAHLTSPDPLWIRTLLVYAAAQRVSPKRRPDTLIDWETGAPLVPPRRGQWGPEFRYVVAD